MEKFQVLEHTADLKIRATGQTIEQMFANMAYGMFLNLMGEQEFLKTVDSTQDLVTQKIDIKAHDKEAMFIDFLNELIYLSDINNEIYFQFDLKIEETSIKGELKGKKVERFKYEIKAVTYNDLIVKEDNGTWVGEVVFDI